MTECGTLPHRPHPQIGNACTEVPAVLVSALAHYLNATTTRLGVPTRAFAHTLADAEWVAEALGERELGARVAAVADRLAVVTARLDVAARPAPEVRTDALWLLTRLDEMNRWTSGWCVHRL